MKSMALLLAALACLLMAAPALATPVHPHAAALAHPAKKKHYYVHRHHRRHHHARAVASSRPACNNGRDDDSDGLIDYPDDSGCGWRGDRSEFNEQPPPPPTDADGDGVPDTLDLCSDTPAGTPVDSSGCPTDGGGGGGSEPAPIAGQGYHESFRDDFNGTGLNPLDWQNHIWWTDPMSGSVSVHDGMVSLYNRRSDGFPDSVDIQTGTEWFEGPSGVPLHSFQFGYFETRMRYTDAVGAWPAFWFASVAHMTANWPVCPEPDLNYELDVYEGQGDEPFAFHGTEHRNTGDVCGTQDDARATPYDAVMPSRVAGSWHTFAVLWTAASVTWYYDGRVVGAAQTFDSGDQQMYMILSMYACGWDQTNACGGSTPDVLEADFDYVTGWQR